MFIQPLCVPSSFLSPSNLLLLYPTNTNYELRFIWYWKDQLSIRRRTLYVLTTLDTSPKNQD